jgi:hypothetical protein
MRVQSEEDGRAGARPYHEYFGGMISDVKTLGYSPPNPQAEPQPAYYVLLPFSVPADVVTSPFQLVGLGWDYTWDYMKGHVGGETVD